MRGGRTQTSPEQRPPPAAGGVLRALAVLAVSGASFAQDPAAGLRYSATPRQREVALGGKLVLDCRLANEGDTPLTVFWGDRAYGDQYRFLIVHEDGTVLRRPYGRPMPPFDVLPTRSFRDLPPGGVLTYNVFLSPRPGRNGQTCYFRRPGRYSADPSLLVVAAKPHGQSDDGKPAFRELWRRVLDAEPVLFRVAEKSAGGGEEQSGPVSIEALVVDTDGRPVPDSDVTARVRRYDRLAGTGMSSTMSLSNWRSVKIDRQRTDERGVVRFARLPGTSPWFELEARHPRHDVAHMRILNQPPEREYTARIVLTPAKTIGGIVVDSDGAPVPGVLIRFYTRYPHPPLETYTEADGRFVLEGVVPRDDGTVRCQVLREGYVGSDPSSPVAVATSRNWRIEIVPNDRLSVSGRAVFADGTPATGMGLRFGSPGTGGAGTQDTVTDGDGRFSVVISRPLPEPVTAWLGPVSRKNAHTPPGRWQTPVKDLRPGREDVELVFENRGVVEVRVEPGNELPPTSAFNVSCSAVGLQFGRERTWSLEEHSVGPTGGTVTFSGLSVGTYELTVADRVAELWRWTQRTTLPAPDGSLRVVVPFRLPQQHFGTVRARVLKPGGTAPVEAGEVGVGASGFGRRIPLEHGGLTVDRVPAGPVVVSCDIRGYEFEIRRKTLRAGGTIDFGEIVLRPERAEEERSGTVEGRVLFEDGTAALGAIVSVPGLGRVDNRGPVGLDGAFRLGCPADGGLLIIDLGDTPLWPRAQVAKDVSPLRGTSLALAWNDRLLLPVDVSPGQTLRRDVVLPCSCTGSVEVKWLGAPDPDPRSSYCALLVHTSAGLLSSGPPRTWSAERGRLAMPIARLPDGRRTVLLRTRDYGGYLDAGDRKRHTTVTFDPGISGAIRGKVTRPDGQPAARTAVRLCYLGLVALGQFRVLVGTPGTRRPMDLGECETAADGTFRFPRVGPGRYVVRAGSTRDAPTREITVIPDEETTVELMVDEWLSPPAPPLRPE